MQDENQMQLGQVIWFNSLFHDDETETAGDRKSIRTNPGHQASFRIKKEKGEIEFSRIGKDGRLNKLMANADGKYEEEDMKKFIHEMHKSRKQYGTTAASASTTGGAKRTRAALQGEQPVPVGGDVQEQAEK